VPFCFVLNPALLFNGDAATVLLAIGAAAAGVSVIAAALQGYVPGLGPVPQHAMGWLVRAALTVGGFLLAAPAPRLTGLSFGANLAAGFVLAMLGLLLTSAMVKTRERGRLSP
jgi:TRAP-type uncharacterized transport system fused permease subunit